MRKLISIVLTMLLSLSIFFSIPSTSVQASSLYEGFHLSTQGYAATTGNWMGQSFTAEVDHTVSSVKFLMMRQGNPGDLTVAIMPCTKHLMWDGGYAHLPTGTILTSVTVPQNDIPEGWGWVEFSLQPYPLNGGDAYAIVTYAPNTSTSSRYIFMGYGLYPDMGGTPYLLGNQVFTWGGWQFNYLVPDLMFEVYGDPCVAGPSGTGSGNTGLMTSKGTLENFTVEDSGTLPPGLPEGFEYPHGFFSFDITGLAAGESTDVTFGAPSALPEGTKWIKWDGDKWQVVDISSDNGDNLITITLTDNGLLDSNPIAGVISDPGGPGVPVVYEAPVASFSANPLSGSAPLDVDFTDSSTGDIDTWSWDFDDDGTVDSSAQNPSYTYSSAGTYTVSLTVSGPGGSDTETMEDYITVSLPTIIVNLDIDPDVINLKSRGQWITACIELPEGYDVNDVDEETICLNNTVAADWAKIGDCNDDGTDDLMVKFDREEVQEILSPGDEVEIKVSGELMDNTPFEGYDSIRVK